MDNVVSIMKSWGATLPYWERYLLQFVLANSSISEEEVLNAYSYFKDEKGLLDSQFLDKQEIKFVTDSVICGPGTAKVLLLEISNCTNVNALAEHQRLTFGPQLTVIYGGNGSGKSGYARVLANAGFTRGDKEVLGNINVLNQNKPSADILVSVDDQEKTIHFCTDESCTELNKLYVFDSTSIKAHLGGEYQFSFTPLGLHYFQVFADQTDRVRQLLHAEINERSKKQVFTQYFSTHSEITSFVSSISPKTDLHELEKYSKFDNEDSKRLDTIPIEIARLSENEINKQIENLLQTAASLSVLVQRLEVNLNILGDSSVTEINQSITAFNNLAFQLNKLKNGISSLGEFTQPWEAFAKSSRELALSLNMSNYPQRGEHCLLCHREMDEEAVIHVTALLNFIRQISFIGFDEAKKNLQYMTKDVQEIQPLDFEIGYSLVIRFVKENDQPLYDNLALLLKSLLSRKDKILSNLQEGKIIKDIPPLNNCLKELRCLLNNIETKVQELKALIPEEVIAKLQQEKVELEHRKLLNQIRFMVLTEIQNIKWVGKALKVVSSTTHITKKQNEVFKELVTDRYIEKFFNNLQSLGRPLEVSVTTSGQKGKTMKQLVLSPQNSSKIRPEKVLSEGEKRAVAFADFLTEVELDPESQGMVLDDPATSLDLEWRKVIAEILIQRSKEKQVVIFTHDLPFLTDLDESAKNNNLHLVIHHITRGNESRYPGYVFLNEKLDSEKGYLEPKKAQGYYDKAMKTYGNEQMDLLRSGFAALRTTYETFVIHSVFGSVVLRFNEHVKMGNLTNAIWDQALMVDIKNGFGRVCRIMEGHSHSDNYSSGEIYPESLKNEIVAFQELATRLKTLRPVSKL